MEILTNLLAHQRAALDWDQIYQEKLASVFNYFLYHTGDQNIAEDLCSDTFERAWAARTRFRKEQAAVGTWLIGIARNVLREHFRRQRRIRETSLDDAIIVVRDEGLESIAETQDFQRKLHKAILALALRERELISLKYGAGLRNKEIAKVMRLSETNVSTLINRTLLKLRVIWEDRNG